MAEKPITLVVQPRGRPIKGLPKEITLSSSSASTSEIYAAVAKKSNFSVHRLRITKGSDGSAVASSGSTPIEATGLRDRSTIAVKDLGPQIAWRTVFVIEYLGPLLIHPLTYYGRQFLYKNPNGPNKPFPAPSELQTLAMWMVVIHFLKREFETLFIHRFSLATMPAFNIFKNSAHYWFLSGFNLAYWVYAPDATTATKNEYSPLVLAGIALFVVGEIGNFYTHLVLRGLRPAGSTQRSIPTGFGFNLVTCPNYMFEIFAWIGVTLVTLSWSTALFLIVASVQMYFWAAKKERRYRKEFPGKYKKKRDVIIPFVL